eukprot:GHVU01163414.1.p1 GENE.GHVU01163414.1~~GHVU01163414.1.p1  ORF type:complete len:776 (-),score=144.99 GHVU01163414.1:1005-3332(-)
MASPQHNDGSGQPPVIGSVRIRSGATDGVTRVGSGVQRQRTTAGLGSNLGGSPPLSRSATTRVGSGARLPLSSASRARGQSCDGDDASAGPAVEKAPSGRVRRVPPKDHDAPRSPLAVAGKGAGNSIIARRPSQLAVPGGQEARDARKSTRFANSAGVKQATDNGFSRARSLADLSYRSPLSARQRSPSCNSDVPSPRRAGMHDANRHKASKSATLGGERDRSPTASPVVLEARRQASADAAAKKGAAASSSSSSAAATTATATATTGGGDRASTTTAGSSSEAPQKAAATGKSVTSGASELGQLLKSEDNKSSSKGSAAPKAGSSGKKADKNSNEAAAAPAVKSSGKKVSMASAFVKETSEIPPERQRQRCKSMSGKPAGGTLSVEGGRDSPTQKDASKRSNVKHHSEGGETLRRVRSEIISGTRKDFAPDGLAPIAPNVVDVERRLNELPLVALVDRAGTYIKDIDKLIEWMRRAKGEGRDDIVTMIASKCGMVRVRGELMGQMISTWIRCSILLMKLIRWNARHRCRVDVFMTYGDSEGTTASSQGSRAPSGVEVSPQLASLRTMGTMGAGLEKWASVRNINADDEPDVAAIPAMIVKMLPLMKGANEELDRIRALLGATLQELQTQYAAPCNTDMTEEKKMLGLSDAYAAEDATMELVVEAMTLSESMSMVDDTIKLKHAVVWNLREEMKRMYRKCGLAVGSVEDVSAMSGSTASAAAATADSTTMDSDPPEFQEENKLIMEELKKQETRICLEATLLIDKRKVCEEEVVN